eukprot:314783-Prymnesium_polylepis.2
MVRAKRPVSALLNKSCWFRALIFRQRNFAFATASVCSGGSRSCPTNADTVAAAATAPSWSSAAIRAKLQRMQAGHPAAAATKITPDARYCGNVDDLANEAWSRPRTKMPTMRWTP